MTIEERILNAKNDPNEMDAFINDYTPFIKASISKTLKKKIDSTDGSLTIGMMAFHEAVQKYDSSKGSFISYAQIVIKSRTIDELKKNNKYKDQEILSTDNEENRELNHYVSEKSRMLYETRKLEEQRRDDLIVYVEVLKSWKLSLDELVQVSPKKKSLLELYKKIGRYIADNPSLLKQMRISRRLPAKDIESNFKIDRKRLDRGRKYIIAVAELWAGDFETLKSYIDGR